MLVPTIHQGHGVMSYVDCGNTADNTPQRRTPHGAFRAAFNSTVSTLPSFLRRPDLQPVEARAVNPAYLDHYPFTRTRRQAQYLAVRRPYRLR